MNKLIHFNLLLIPFSLAVLNSNMISDPPGRIVLDPDKIDEFVLDPAHFDPDDTDALILRHEPFGRKDEALYTRDTKQDGTPVIMAKSESAISSVTTPIDADPHIFQYLEWEWMIEAVLENGDLTQKSGDDFVARVYVTFDYDSSDLSFGDRVRYRLYRTFTSFEIPLRSLNYIWANKADVGTIAESPFTSWVQYIAVQSGNGQAGGWHTEKRNIVDDYRAAFGEEPKRITGITIMTDSDNTGESSRAWFGKIKLSKE